MLSIIAYHFLVHGAKVSSGPEGSYAVEDESSVAYILLKSFLVLSVNCFVFISGFYRIKFKITSILNLLLQVSFYGILITLIYSLLAQHYLGFRYYVEAIFSIFTGTWWFITAYFALYLLSPLLNAAVDTFSKKQFLFVVAALTIINCISGFLFSAGPMGVNRGYSLVSFIHIYLLAQYIKKYINLDTLKKWAAAVYIITCIIIFLLALLSIGELGERGIGRIYAYNNPLVLIAAISFFFIFLNFSLKSRIINGTSPYVLGIYLFHDHPFMRKHLIEKVYTLSQQDSALKHFLILAISTCIIFIIGYLVDRFREFLLTPLTHYLIRRFDLLKLEDIFTTKNTKTSRI